MLRKILIGLIAFVILFLASLAVLPIIFKAKLMTIAKQQIDAQVNAQIEWSDIGVSAFKDFPGISLYAKNLVVINDAPFKGDTLAKVAELVISLNPMKLLKGKHVEISGITIDRPYIYVRVMKDGTANYNIMKPDSVKTPATAGGNDSYSISLKKFTLKNAHLVYDDKELELYAELKDFSNKFSGNFGKNKFELTDKGAAGAVTVRSGKIAYLNKVKVALKIAMDVDQTKGKYSFRDNTIQLNDLALGINGSVVMLNSKNITADLSFNAKEPDFKHLISLLPAVYSDDFKKVKTSGTLTLQGYAKGKYDGIAYPAFGLNLKVDNASFQYPDLPAAVTGIDIDVQAKNPGGSLDNTIVDIDKFNVNLGGDPFSAKLVITSPVLDPEMDGSMSGNLDLGKVKNYYPMNGDRLNGLVTMDLKAKGRLSAIEKQQYDNFNASGTVEMHDIKFISKELPKTFEVNELKLSLQPELVSLDTFSAVIGKSDFSASGQLDNLLNYVFSKAVLKGTMKLQSKALDMNEFLTEDPKAVVVTGEKKTETKPVAKNQPQMSSKAAQVPANIDFKIDFSANRIYYGNIVLDSVAGEVLMRNETVTLNSLQGKAFDGTLMLNGDYTTLRTESPVVDMKVNLNMVNVEKAVAGLENMVSSLPILKSVRGAMSTVFAVKTELDRQMSPKMKTMIADGRIDVHHMEFSGNKTVNTMAERMKMNELKMIKAKDFFTVVKIAKGTLYVAPFNIPMAKINITVYGSHDLTDTGSMNYSMLMDAAGGGDSLSSAGKPGKHTKYKVGINSKSGPSYHQAADDNDSELQKAKEEQQSITDAAEQAKQQSENDFKAEQEKRKAAAQQKAEQRVERKKQHAEQKAKDQANSNNATM